MEYYMSTGRLNGKIAIVTGGARGMGAATARIFVREGATVVIADMLNDQGAALAEELGAQASFVMLNVADEDGWIRLVADLMQRHGRIDALVNNAGVVSFCEIGAIEMKEFDRVYDVNVRGPLLGMKHVGRVMRAARAGAIVNVSSIDGTRGVNSLAVYSSSKWAVRGLTRSAALEFGPFNVRVNSVHPGGVNTDMTNPRHIPKAELPVNIKVPLQRLGEAEEVAAANLFLCSDEASYISGAELLVDGGWGAGTYYPRLPGAPAGLQQ